jgi:REP element-mobilizing transposase RayT
MRRRSHAEIYFHFVWTPKLHKKVITPAIETLLHQIISEKCKECRYRMIALGGAEDHVHLLLRTNVTDAPCAIAKNVKGPSSRGIALEFPDTKNFEWQRGYGVFSVSPHDVEMISRYIRNQKTHHKEMTIIDELEDTGDENEDE